MAFALSVLGLAALATSAPSVAPSSGALVELRTWLTNPTVGGLVAPSIILAESQLCGLTLFAAEDLVCDELIGRVPLDACLSAEAACNDPCVGAAAREVLAQFGYSTPGQHIVTAALLAHARLCDGDARAKWAPYVDSLPWGEGESGELSDSLAQHPLVIGEDCVLSSVGGFEVRLADRLQSVYRTAEWVHQMLDGTVSPERCFRAVVLVGSRAFDLASRWREVVAEADRDGLCDWSITMIPFFDMSNHPSQSLLDAMGEAGARFRKLPNPKLGAMRWDCDWDTRQLVIYSPPAFEVYEGEELLNYYSHAGAYEREPQARAHAEANFVTQYGFSPWH